MTIEPRKERVGMAGFPALLIDASVINRSDFSLAEQHAIREQMDGYETIARLRRMNTGNAVTIPR